MIPFEVAYESVTKNTYTPAETRVSIAESLGRALVQDIVADMDMPPFNKSAVDGYACRRSDISSALEVIEVIPAGKQPEKEITAGTCSKIMTGGVIPPGADCVLMVENTVKIDKKMIQALSQDSSVNICYQGEDIRKSAIVLRKGVIITPQHIAVMASMGCASPCVAVQPKVGIITTGEEIVEPHLIPESWQIRNSNAYQLMAQVKDAGGIPYYRGIVPDKEEILLKTVDDSLKEDDLLIITGGVSMGDFDIVPDVLKKAGVDIKFQHIAIQPGKPTLFGTYGNKPVFGLPGNPVSSYLQFELLVRPLLYMMLGIKRLPSNIQCKLAADYSRRRSERLSLVPVRIENLEAVPVEYHGSAHINSLNDADGVMFVPIGITSIKKGSLIDVRPF